MELEKLETKALLEELNRRLPKEKIKQFLEKREDLKKAIGETITRLARAKVDAPEQFFKYPARDKFTTNHFLDWFDKTELLYHIAKRYEEQERGYVCSVDRAYRDWLKPECDKMLNYILS